MHRTAVGDFQEPRALCIVERAVERDGPLDAVELTFPGRAGRAIGGVNLRMPEPHRDLRKRQRLLVGIEAQRHRGAGAEAGEQEFVWRRATVAAAGRHRLVGDEMMRLYPYDKVKGELADGKFDVWKDESYRLASTEAYTGIEWFKPASDAYKKKAFAIAQRRS